MNEQIKFNQPAKLPLPTEKLFLPDNKSCNGRNMIYPGYLEITNKVLFVFHELKEPSRGDYYSNSSYLDPHAGVFSDWNYEKDCKAYEASKRTVEVENVKKVKYHTRTIWMYKYRCGYIKLAGKMVVNNQKCKAEVNGTAKIIELL